MNINAVEQYRDVMASAWDSHIEQLSPGSFGCEVQYTVSPTTLFFREKVSASCRTDSALRDGLMGFGVSNDQSMESGRWWNSNHPANGLPYGAAGTALDAVFPEENDKYVVMMEEETFRTKFEILAGRDADFLNSTDHFLAMSRSSVVSIRGQLAEELRRHTQSPAGSGELENNLIQILVNHVEHPYQVVLKTSGRKSLVLDAISLAQEEGFTVSAATLAVKLKCSRRTLEYSFLDCLGVSPAHYFKVRRLNMCRKRLAFADPADNTVQEIASQLGFNWSGRFASDYKLFFGEFPHQTLARYTPRSHRGF